MKRFWVFAGSSYYPAGGIEDFLGQFDTFEAARAACDASAEDWAHVVDTQAGTWTDVDRRHGVGKPNPIPGWSGSGSAAP